jgi:hypothetical protein
VPTARKFLHANIALRRWLKAPIAQTVLFLVDPHLVLWEDSESGVSSRSAGFNIGYTRHFEHQGTKYQISARCKNAPVVHPKILNWLTEDAEFRETKVSEAMGRARIGSTIPKGGRGYRVLVEIAVSVGLFAFILEDLLEEAWNRPRLKAITPSSCRDLLSAYASEEASNKLLHDSLR